ncbi:gamma-glutamyltransferase family protein [Paenibacillus thermotolerans]|uniref:gamma-glutamyltransferase family protein n=1 Tax=Paenibacillus thermotolerans TaxID=3027807 RepID=UPI00236754B4|nr:MULTISPECIES: gamma-glutamyltransferase family protein [unclassified Paenibacillus]
MVSFDPLHYPYPSRRNAVYARKGMVSTSHPLAAEAGLEALRRGGNAIDAAVAAAACLTVVEPTSNGIGGDAFALVWTGGKLHGLNASGPAPQSLTIDAVRAAGFDAMPTHGWLPVTVPGAPSAWAELARRFGRLPLTESLAPAIRYAEEGFPVSPTVGYYWSLAEKRYRSVLTGAEFEPWFELFAPGGRAPAIGELWRSPAHAATLREIAESGAESFYRGGLAERVDAFSRAHGGFLRAEDLAAYAPEWVEPLGVRYKGYDVWEIPPNGQGMIALMALNMLSGDVCKAREDAESYHMQIEAMKLAFADGKRYITQRDKMPIDPALLLSAPYAAERRALIGESARQPEAGRPDASGTVYLAAADGDGNMVSFIQSNYMGFGSGLVVPGTGISLQNRGHNFSLDETHANALEPGKKTYHTIIPGFLTKDGEAVGPFGVMGGFMQPQGHMQVVMNMIDFGLNPQAALDAPRWQWVDGLTVELEHGVPESVALALSRRGHNIRRALGSGGFGRGQIIVRGEGGVLIGGVEPRADSAAAVF